MGHVVGIDLGTTNSLVAHMRVGRDGASQDARPEIIANQAGKRLTPSIVGIDKHDKIHVGDTAKNQLVAMPERTVAEVKRLMGSSQKVRLGAREYTPQEISGFILRRLKDDAERHFGEPVGEAVITVPAYFTDAQRQATKDAGELAGFRVDRILNEPTAAALAYGLDHLDKEQFVLVYDLGGGTFDVSVLEMFEGVLDVKASAGNNHLGGGDFDRAVADWLAREFELLHGIDLRRDMKAMVRLKQAAEQAKIELSSLSSTAIMLPFIAVKGAEPLSLELELSRAKLEELIGALIRSTLEPIESALRDARLDKSRITDVVTVGGSSRIPLVQALLAEWFGKEARRGVHPDEAIALGAAVQAGLTSGALSTERGIMITDVCPFTLGVEVVGNAGAQRMGGMFSPIIPRNSTVPVSRTEVYSTTAEGQRVVDIKVYQGESRLTKNNTFLDSYSIDGIPPAPMGHEKVAITFTYDVNGILNVKTKIVSTGKEALLVVDKSPERMSDGDKARAKDRIGAEWNADGEAARLDAECDRMLERGRVDDALLYAERAARLLPLDPRRHRVIADLYRRKQLLPQAKAALERAQALAPDDGRIVAELRDLELELGGAGAVAATPAVGRIGVLGWSPSGGAVSPLEAVAVVGHGQLLFSGNVGEISREAGLVAFSCLKQRARELAIDGLVAAYDLHLHFVDTEVGKEGPSAGLALLLAGLSAYQQKPLRAALAATGEITLHGEVKPVGGIHEKLVAAHLAGYKTVLLPRRNAKEVRELPSEIASSLELVLVDTVADAIGRALA